MPLDSVPQHWPFAQVLTRLALAVAVGVLVGLEREHNQKTGVRTFALTALLGCLGGMMGTTFAAIATGYFALAAVGMGYRSLIQTQRLGLTTSAALVIVGFAGILVGQGHVFTPAAAGIITAALLAWKQPISKFAIRLSDEEVRSAILLAILSFIVFPVLPNHPVDRWGLIDPRENWASVIIIAGIGFINYILMKSLGARGMEITAFFGGLINSRKVIVELGLRLRQLGKALQEPVNRGIMLATAAMLIRNGLIAGVLAPAVLRNSALPLALMLAANTAVWLGLRRRGGPDAQQPILGLQSPFKLLAALQFGLVFLALNVIGALAQRHFGSASFYFVMVAGGLLSSASSIAAATTLAAHHEITAAVGGTGVVLSTITSVLANLPLVRGLVPDARLKRKLTWTLCALAAVGLAGIALNAAWPGR
ncbi:MAG TPA: DUF4010 domain-containing protein [Opitutaceae bacterium]|nr:DUF4010 domain-containing protein [Opitutaceae bacterium]